jgi:hypothetical protein
MEETGEQQGLRQHKNGRGSESKEMSIYAIIDGLEPSFFSSNSGWADVVSWTDRINENDYETVVHLAEHGYSEDVPVLQSQLQDAMEASPPDASVAATLAELMDLLVDAEIVFITDGTSIVSEQTDSPEQQQIDTEALTNDVVEGLARSNVMLQIDRRTESLESRTAAIERSVSSKPDPNNFNINVTVEPGVAPVVNVTNEVKTPNVSVAAPNVTVAPTTQATRTTITRDKNGDISETVTEPI